MSRLLHTLAVAGLFWAAGAAYAQPQNGGTNVRGKVVRIDGQDKIVLQTPENKEVILTSSPTTRYVINGKEARFADLRNGVTLSANYTIQENRYIVTSIDIADEPGAGAPNADRRIRARVVRVDAPSNKIVARTQDGREVTLMVGPNAKILRAGQNVKLADVQVSALIETVYVERDNHWWVEEVTIVPDAVGGVPPAPTQPAPTADATQVQGTIIRIVGQNQIVIRTSDNKEVTIDVQPQTTYMINDQPTQLNAFQPGHDVRVTYNVRDRRNLAARILGNRR